MHLDRLKSSDFWSYLFTEGWRPYFWIALLGAAVYFRSVFFGFAYFDDDHLILENFHRLADLKNILLAFRTDMNWQSPGTYYRPLVTLTFIGDALWSGRNPWGYHLSNVIFHLTASCLLFRLFRTLKYSHKISLAFCLTFAVHPVLNHAVAFIPGRYDSLLAVFSLFALTTFIKYLERPSPALLLAHLLSFTAALFTKETAVILPGAGLLYYLLFHRREFRKILAPALIWLTGLSLFLFLRRQAVGPVSVNYNTFAENLAGLVSYLGKIFFPFDLSVMPIPENTSLWPGMIALTGLLGLLILGGLNRKRHFMFGLGCFLLFLAPTAARTLGFAYLLEQRLYLPMTGFFIMLMESRAVLKVAERKFAPLFLALLLALLSAVSLWHLAVYRDDISFWGNAVKYSPDSYFAHNVLGQRYAARDRWPEAEAELARAADLNPGNAAILHDLGLILYQQKKYPQAQAAFQGAVDADSLGADAGLYLRLAKSLIKQGLTLPARKPLKQAFALDPVDVEANELLSFLFLNLGQRDSSLYYYHRAVRLGLPYNPEVIRLITGKDPAKPEPQ
ncbi:MAG: glycosyltransferase family 39 protein [Candidatus Edwardsbacteria bacterium]|nr:glycosyltransferase family 39 protein [Candidatus Edwardsbacteria bacterium]